MNMKYVTVRILVVATLMTMPLAMARDLSKGYPSDADEMDANKDGMISKDEFMRFQTDIFTKMQNAKGLVPVEDMQKYLRGPGNEAH